MEPRDEGATRPASLAVGQRYIFEDVQSMGPFVVTVVTGGNATIKYEKSGYRGNFSHRCIEQTGRYLGTSAPPAPVGVRAGQRRRWNVGHVGHQYGPFVVVEESPGMFFGRYAFDSSAKRTAALSPDQLARQTTLLADAPTEGATPGTPTTQDLPLTRSAVDGGLTGAGPGGQKPARFPKREVRTTGGTWISYDKMTDPDPFEAYPLRRVDGVVAAMVTEPTVRVVGTYTGHSDAGWEVDVAWRMRAEDEKRRANVAAPAPSPAPPLARRRFLDGARRDWELP